MTVDTMKGSEGLTERENGKILREVIIYESGSPVLKVESGTTLKVLKLLYGTEHEKKREILGVRPKNIVEGIPCIITLDESKLSEISYDILVSEGASASKSENNNNNSSSDETIINRCIDCSRESWKTKRFTNVGMNTEVSVNPGTELDLSKISVNGSQKPSNNNNNNNTQQPEKQFNAKNNSPPSQPSPPSVQTRANAGVSYLPQKEYVVSMSKPTQNGTAHTHEGEPERASERSPPSPTYGLEAFNTHRNTQIRYPALEPPIHYDRFVQSHTWMVERPPRYDGQNRSPHRDQISPNARRSPMHHRSRSPLSPRVAAEIRAADVRGADYTPHYHGFHEKYRPVLLPANYPHGRNRREERVRYAEGAEEKREAVFLRKDYQREGGPPHGHVAEFHHPVNEKVHRPPHVQPGDEPPVFVLPNDYDIVSGIDPRVASLQDKRSAKYPSPPPANEKGEKEEEKAKENNEKEQSIKDEYQNSPNGSNGCYSPKPTNGGGTTTGTDSPDSSTNNTQKLYCKICSGVFPTKSLLYKHLRGHTSDEKPFKCNECGQGFTLSSNLRQHRIIHRGYKPFQCEFCGKKFMRSNVYKQHRRIHTGEEMHKCGLCPSEFLQKYALLKHMKKNHDIDAVDN